MADNRQINELYAKIGQELIDSEDALFDIRNSHATIIYLSSDLTKTDKQRLVLGQCERVADKYKWSHILKIDENFYLPLNVSVRFITKTR